MIVSGPVAMSCVMRPMCALRTWLSVRCGTQSWCVRNAWLAAPHQTRIEPAGVGRHLAMAMAICMFPSAPTVQSATRTVPRPKCEQHHAFVRCAHRSPRRLQRGFQHHVVDFNGALRRQRHRFVGSRRIPDSRWRHAGAHICIMDTGQVRGASRPRWRCAAPLFDARRTHADDRQPRVQRDLFKRSH